MGHRRHGIIRDEVSPELQAKVNRFLTEGCTYDEVTAFLRKEGYEISRSSVGRYAKNFAQTVSEFKLLQKQSAELIDQVGDDPMVMQDAVTALFSMNLVKAQLAEEIDAVKSAKLMQGFASLVKARIASERLKDELRSKAAKAVENIEKKAKNLDPDTIRMIREEVYGLVG